MNDGKFEQPIPPRYLIGEAHDEAKRIQDLTGTITSPGDHQAAHDLLIEQEVTEALKDKDWSIVFVSGEMHIGKIFGYEQQRIEGNVIVNRTNGELERLQQDQEAKEEVRQKLAKAEGKKDEMDFENTYCDEFLEEATAAIEQEMIAALPKSNTLADREKIRDLIQSFKDKMFNAHFPDDDGRPSKPPNLTAEEIDLYKRALAKSIEITETKLARMEEERTAKENVKRKAEEGVQIFENHLKIERTKLAKTIEILDQQEQAMDIPELYLGKINPEARRQSVEDLLKWRKELCKKNQENIERIRREMQFSRHPIGEKWAFYWQTPDELDHTYILLNKDQQGDSVYPDHILNYRLPGQTIAVYSEALYMSDKVVLQSIIENGMPRYPRLTIADRKPKPGSVERLLEAERIRL